VKALGALVCTQANAPGRVPAILTALERRLAHIQRVAPSLHARALLANAMLGSCLWYFLMFELLPSLRHCAPRLGAHLVMPVEQRQTRSANTRGG
jgi:hypothetical protein